MWIAHLCRFTQTFNRHSTGVERGQWADRGSVCLQSCVVYGNQAPMAHETGSGNGTQVGQSHTGAHGASSPPSQVRLANHHFFCQSLSTPLPGPPLQSFNHCGKKTAVTKVALLCKNQGEMKHFSNLKPSTLHFWGGFSTNPVWHLARWVGEETV